MGAEDRLAGLLARLDGLPVRVRRLLVVVVPIVLLGLLVAGFVLAPRGREHATARKASTTPTRTSTSPSAPAVVRRDPMPPVGSDANAGPVAGAVDPARAFVESYVAFSYGHARLSAIRGADPRLVATLGGERARVPPAQRARRPRVVALRVVAFSPGVARATAMIADGSGIRYPLVFMLDQRPGGWLVTRMAD